MSRCQLGIALCHFVFNPLSLGVQARPADLKLKTLKLAFNYEPLQASSARAPQNSGQIPIPYSFFELGSSA